MNNQGFKYDNINLISVIKILLSERKIIYKSFIYSFLIALFFSIILPVKYTSQSTFVPQLSSKGGIQSSSISGLASLAGIDLSDLNDENSDISPLIYPLIIESVPFRLQLLESTIIYESKNMSLRKFLIEQYSPGFFTLIKKYTIRLPSLIIGFFKNNNPDDYYQLLGKNDIYKITKEDHELFEILSELVSLSLNEKDGFITISSSSEYKIVSAQITKNAETILQSKIIEFKSKSSKELLSYTKSQYNLKRSELNKLQDEIALFKDQNININSSLFQNRLNRLISESQVLQNVVGQLASQVEQAKLQVNKDTPVFTIIQPANIPYFKSSPSKTMIVFLVTFFGILLTSLYLLFKNSIFSLFSDKNVL